MNNDQYSIISNAIDYIAAHWRDRPGLEFLAARAGYETTHFQKLFTRMTGVSPQKMVQYMAAHHARDLLLRQYSTLDAAYDSGISGNARLHDAMVNIIAATPGDVKRKGAGLVIRYGYHPTPMGDMLIAQTNRGLCWLGFVVDEDRTVPMARLRRDWELADFVADQCATVETAQKILDIWHGRDAHVTLHLYGTNFQLQVWQALLKIPCGASVSYKAVADAIGKPTASRAVGSAVGANPVSLLIPCHRVIQSSGVVENYGWGTPRKKLILGLETAPLRDAL